jgi:hypothetical protein
MHQKTSCCTKAKNCYGYGGRLGNLARRVTKGRAQGWGFYTLLLKGGILRQLGIWLHAF